MLQPTTQSELEKKTQQEFLHAAMAEMEMTRAAFSRRIGCARRTLDKWLLPATSNDSRKMNETIWILVQEILAHEQLKARVSKAENQLKNSA